MTTEAKGGSFDGETDNERGVTQNITYEQERPRRGEGWHKKKKTERSEWSIAPVWQREVAERAKQVRKLRSIYQQELFPENESGADRKESNQGM